MPAAFPPAPLLPGGGAGVGGGGGKKKELEGRGGDEKGRGGDEKGKGNERKRESLSRDWPKMYFQLACAIRLAYGGLKIMREEKREWEKRKRTVIIARLRDEVGVGRHQDREKKERMGEKRRTVIIARLRDEVGVRRPQDHRQRLGLDAAGLLELHLRVQPLRRLSQVLSTGEAAFFFHPAAARLWKKKDSKKKGARLQWAALRSTFESILSLYSLSQA